LGKKEETCARVQGGHLVSFELMHVNTVSYRMTAQFTVILITW